jgi:type IV secretory pathway VirB4 component
MATPVKQDAGNSLDLVDIKEIKESTVIVKDGSFRQIVMVGGVNFSLKSDEEQSIITGGYQTFLNSIDFPLQILIHSRKVNIDAYIATLTARRDEEQAAILQSQIDEYINFIKGFVEKNAIMEKIFLVVVSYHPISLGGGIKNVQSSLSLPFFGGGKKKDDESAKAKNKEDADKTFAEQLAQMSQRTTQVISGLQNIGLETTILNDEQLVELFYNFYNPQTVEKKTAINAPAGQ